MNTIQPSTFNFSAILASSVHDIKNSLSTLSALIAQLESAYPDLKPPEFQQLEFEANRMNNSLMQLLILYKIDASLFNLDIEEYPALDILNEVVAQQSTLQSLSHIELSVECDEDLLCYCDNNLITNAISTLVNNAQRYCRSKILLTAYQQDDGYVVFCIEDDGDGYPENFLAYSPTQNTLIDLTSGNTGLGLFFVSTIANMHVSGNKKGFINTDNNSQLGGARFRLSLP